MQTRTETYQILRWRIKYHRAAAKISQKDLAAALGWKISKLSNIERGSTKPDLHTLRELCQPLKITLPTLLDGF
jgi:transcriptional regulator with XRE-family HTH domain